MRNVIVQPASQDWFMRLQKLEDSNDIELLGVKQNTNYLNNSFCWAK